MERGGLVRVEVVLFFSQAPRSSRSNLTPRPSVPPAVLHWASEGTDNGAHYQVCVTGAQSAAPLATMGGWIKA